MSPCACPCSPCAACPDGFLAVQGAVGLGVAVLAASRIRRVAPVPEAEREPFVGVPRTTAAVAELDPRTAPEEEPELADG